MGDRRMSLAIAENLPPDAREAFDKRWQRVADCIAGRAPDRMPVSLIGGFWFAKYGGITCRQLMYDFETSNQIGERAIVEFEPDIGGGANFTASWGPLWDKVDFRQLEWAGHGVSEDSPYQYIDKEYMPAEEYDEFIFDPTGYLLEKYLPRVAGAFSGFNELAGLAGNFYLGVPASTFMFQQPNVIASFERLKECGQEAAKIFASNFAFGQRMASLGFPPIAGGGTQAPYDVLADFMRGAKNMMKDLYRRPEKVLAALEKVTALTLKRVLATTPRGGSPIVVIPIHWAADNFMSAKQFEKFFWPSLRQLMMGLVEHGFVPMPLWEADCTKRLETIADMPPNSCIYWFENTDMVKAYEVLGNNFALYGGLGASLMATGSTGDIDAAVRHLAENVFHKGGRLILSTATPMPEETPIENVRAMFGAARKYGA